MQFYFGSGVFLLRLLPGLLVLLLRGISKWFCPMLHMECKWTNMNYICFQEETVGWVSLVNKSSNKITMTLMWISFLIKNLLISSLKSSLLWSEVSFYDVMRKCYSIWLMLFYCWVELQKPLTFLCKWKEVNLFSWYEKPVTVLSGKGFNGPSSPNEDIIKWAPYSQIYRVIFLRLNCLWNCHVIFFVVQYFMSFFGFCFFFQVNMKTFQ